MKTIFTLFFSAILFSASANMNADTANTPSTKFDNNKIHEILLSVCDSVKGVKGNWQVIYKRRYLFIITDESHNRMRIITPVVEEKKLKKEDMKTLLEANFHKALDAKYCLYNSFLWSAFMHPLIEMNTVLFKDAMNQVVQLADTYGTSYTSTDLIFGGGK